MSDSPSGRLHSAYVADAPGHGCDDPDARARTARRRRLVEKIDGALEAARANDPDWLDVSAVLSQVRCELSRDLRDRQPRESTRSAILAPESSDR
jgi:hypothetical protein